MIITLWLAAAVAAIIAVFPRLLVRRSTRTALFGQPTSPDLANRIRLAAIAALGIFLALIYFDIKP